MTTAQEKLTAWLAKLAPGDLIAVQNFVLALQAKAVRPNRSALLTGRGKARNALSSCRDNLSETIIEELQHEAAQKSLMESAHE